MIFTAVDSTTGQVMFSGTTDNLDFDDTTGLRFITGVAYDGGWVDGSDVHHDVPPPPGGPHEVWDWEDAEWVDPRTLAEAQADQVEVIRAAELAAVLGGFVWSTDTFASDEDSQRRITLAMTCAVVAQRDATSMSIDWPLADGSYRTLDEADLVALGQALHAHIAAQMATAQGLYASIAAAATNAAVMAVVWP